MMKTYRFLSSSILTNVFRIGLVIELKKLSVHGSLVELVVEPPLN